MFQSTDIILKLLEAVHHFFLPMNIKEEFIKQFGCQAYLVGFATDFPPEILLTQAALETGWGRYIHANDLFGIKDLPCDPGYTRTETTEVEEERKKVDSELEEILKRLGFEV
jgi:flagellum-specific peptidoglycan hydrolase FlgJ